VSDEHQGAVDTRCARPFLREDRPCRVVTRHGAASFVILPRPAVSMKTDDSDDVDENLPCSTTSDDSEVTRRQRKQTRPGSSQARLSSCYQWHFNGINSMPAIPSQEVCSVGNQLSTPSSHTPSSLGNLMIGEGSTRKLLDAASSLSDATGPQGEGGGTTA
jgi:hypothetical protein